MKSYRSFGRIVLTAAALGFAATHAYASKGGKVTIQPIIVRDDMGNNAPNWKIFGPETQKIWDQANLSISWLTPNFFNDTALQNIDGTNAADDTPQPTFDDLTKPGHGQNANPLVIDMWFVHTISMAWGEGFLGGNGIAISSDTVTANNRLDTEAHELGHNLGLDHVAGADFLMNPGDTRDVPTGLGEINPDGKKWDKLSADEIKTACASQFVTPEPGSLALLATGGLPLLGLLRRRRTA
jgi:hypothetical protein